jgi:hypothetical protein
VLALGYRLALGAATSIFFCPSTAGGSDESQAVFYFPENSEISWATTSSGQW